jgi:hypothetical protein
MAIQNIEPEERNLAMRLSALHIEKIQRLNKLVEQRVVRRVEQKKDRL